VIIVWLPRIVLPKKIRRRRLCVLLAAVLLLHSQDHESHGPRARRGVSNSIHRCIPCHPHPFPCLASRTTALWLRRPLTFLLFAPPCGATGRAPIRSRTSSLRLRDSDGFSDDCPGLPYVTGAALITVVATTTAGGGFAATDAVLGFPSIGAGRRGGGARRRAAADHPGDTLTRRTRVSQGECEFKGNTVSGYQASGSRQGGFEVEMRPSSTIELRYRGCQLLSRHNCAALTASATTSSQRTHLEPSACSRTPSKVPRQSQEGRLVPVAQK
jgi:hypothetical protein